VALHSLLDEDLVVPRLEARDRDGVLREMTGKLEARHKAVVGDGLLEKLLEREEMGTTAIGQGLAIPHCRTKKLKSPALLLGLSKDGIPFESVDGQLAHVFFLLISPQDNPNAGLRLLAAIAALNRGSRTLAVKLLKAGTAADILKILKAEEEKTLA
jgi:mannitol/fructose-specific phosphotransferase system IIA component (Ntr-type)